MTRIFEGAAARAHRYAIALSAAACAQGAAALCLNPFGCKPETRAECVEQAKEARTETAAKALLAQCNRLPEFSRAECGTMSDDWVAHMRKTDGRQWTWQKRARIEGCRAAYPETFDPNSWPTRPYCDANRQRIAENRAKLNPATGRPSSVEDYERQGDTLGSRIDHLLLTSLDNYQLVSAFQQAFYADFSETQVAEKMGLDAPADANAVGKRCDDLLGVAR